MSMQKNEQIFHIETQLMARRKEAVLPATVAVAAMNHLV